MPGETLTVARRSRIAARPLGVLPAVIVFAVLALLAFCLSGYQLFQLTNAVAYGIAIIGLVILTGYSGQISLGNGAFYAVGAYVTAILMTTYNVPYWATLPVSAVVCAIFGLLVGFPALRLGGLYLALTTFALAVAMPQLLKYQGLQNWTGGVQGIVITKPDPPEALASLVSLTGDQWLYLFSLAVAAALYVLARNLLRGRIGRAFVAVRDHPMAAEAMGVDIAMVKTGAFAVSALYTGIAGSLGAIAVQFVAPDSFDVFLSITLFVGLVVGGVASIGGALFGALFIVYVPNLAQQISRAAPGAVYGALLIGIMFLMPAGVAGTLAWLRRKR